MPRTKITRNTKRTREASNRDDKIREFENALQGYMNIFDSKIEDIISSWDNEIKMLIQRTNSTLLSMNMSDFLKMDIGQFSDWEQSKTVLNKTTSMESNSNSLLPVRNIDEGYLTEASSNSGSIGSSVSSSALLNASQMRQQQQRQQGSRFRTPGPLSSACARRPRRSRSACNDYLPKATNSNLTKNLQSGSKMRTPIASTNRAQSADRNTKSQETFSPPAAFLRWPKPGEMALSKCGSPLVTQLLPDKYANVNIPIRNGAISLLPKRLSELQPDIIEAIDMETLDQLKTLHANLDKIVSLADKITLK